MENFWNNRKSHDAYKRTSTQTAEEAAHFDRARIIHSSAFRRLQGKTQALSLGESDFYRNRLTHSLEVAQLATGALLELKKQAKEDQEKQSLLPAANLVEAIGLAHDIGHPAFGHDGERTLNFCMKDHGGFEGNGQTLRIISKLGEYSFNDGFDLTRRTLLGVVKYPIFYSDALNPAVTDENPPKCILDSERDIFEWILSPLSESDQRTFCEINKENPKKHYRSLYKSFDCSIMEVADDIAYGVHDLEDMLALRLITLEDWDQYVIEPLQKLNIQSPIIDKRTDNKYNLSFYREKLFSKIERERKWGISMLVGYFLQNVRFQSNDQFNSPVLRFNVTLSDEATITLDHMTKLVFNHVIRTPQVKTLEYKSRKLVRELFEVFSEKPEFMSVYYYELYKRTQENKPRIICDYLSGMTDGYASKQYQRLFIPDMGSIYDR